MPNTVPNLMSVARSASAPPYSKKQLQPVMTISDNSDRDRDIIPDTLISNVVQPSDVPPNPTVSLC